MADGFGLREKLDARISVARRKLFWPSLVRSAVPAALWFTGFAVFWLTGLYTAMPPEAQAMAARCWPAPEIAATMNRDELGNLKLTETEEAQIVAFLKTLTDR